MPRYVRLSKDPLGPEQIGVAILPDGLTDVNTLDASGQTWEAAGYELHSWDDTGEIYEP